MFDFRAGRLAGQPDDPCRILLAISSCAKDRLRADAWLPSARINWASHRGRQPAALRMTSRAAKQGAAKEEKSPLNFARRATHCIGDVSTAVTDELRRPIRQLDDIRTHATLTQPQGLTGTRTGGQHRRGNRIVLTRRGGRENALKNR